jgi:hypothetical protein
MNRCMRVGSLGVLPALLLVSCDWFGSLSAHKPAIEFAPYAAGYQSKPDFARVEHEYPLRSSEQARAALASITPAYLAGLDQEQVDQIYARLSAGPIPDGAFDGELFFPKGMSGKRRIAEIAGDGLGGLAVNLKVQKLELIGEVLWKGKVFYRQQHVLRNRIDDLAVLRPLIEGKLDDIPKISVNGHDAWLLFPAKLYCGQSLLDGRRESIIIDYAFNDELEGYRERPDFLAGRHGFRVRDEIRMVRPGFYLGRAYMDRIFILNFTLYNKELAERDTANYVKTGKIAEDCWPGTQVVVSQ